MAGTGPAVILLYPLSSLNETHETLTLATRVFNLLYPVQVSNILYLTQKEYGKTCEIWTTNAHSCAAGSTVVGPTISFDHQMISLHQPRHHLTDATNHPRWAAACATARCTAAILQ